MLLPSKDPAERKLLKFEFDTQIEAGQTIQSLVRQISVVEGTDPTPTAMFDVDPSIDNVNLQALQWATGGVDGCDYEIRMLATDSSGGKHLIVARLPVRVEH